MNKFNIGNRKIKFRAWDKKDEEMFNCGNMRHWLLEDAITGKDLIPMQFTGLLDKHGKEIYEGDIAATNEEISIVKYGIFQSSHEAGFSRHHFHTGFFLVDIKGEQIWDNVSEDIEWDDVEVIGNIFENKELLTIGTAE